MKITAILCNYNHAAYIRRALDAVVTQSRKPDEYIVVDDGSTDKSIDIIRDYAQNYPFIKVIEKSTNTGYAHSRQLATEAATGDFFHLGAADDYMLPGFFERAENLLMQYPNVGIISAAHYIENEDGDWMFINNCPKWTTDRYVAPSQYVNEYLMTGDTRSTLAPATLFSRKALEEFGPFPTELGTWDVSFFLQYAALKFGACYIHEPMYSWISRNEGWTAHTNRDLNGILRTYLAYYNKMISLPYRTYFPAEFAERWINDNVCKSVNEFLSNELRAIQNSN